jgi:hypothetical protein
MDIKNNKNIATREIRAVYDDQTIRVYQAYSDLIADSTLAAGAFVSPPFKMERMTWIKPSFLWMMYRAGWSLKDAGQKRILAIDISRDGFEWALQHACLSHAGKGVSDEAWQRIKDRSPVRVQWDPGRDLHLQPQQHRAIQIGLSGEAVKLYVNQWIRSIQDITPLALQVHGLMAAGQEGQARLLLPQERIYRAGAAVCAIMEA